MRILEAVAARIRSEIGADEIVLTCGLGLLTAGLWTLCGWSALIAPGAVLTWMALPGRAPFVRSTSADQSERRS